MTDQKATLLNHFGLKKLFWCLFLLAALLVMVVFLFPNNDAVPINNERTQSFNENWLLENTGEIIQLPYMYENAANEHVVISKVLPHVFEQSNPTLSFNSSLQTVIVKVEDRVIYTYAHEPDAYLDVQPPPAWHVIRLSPDMEGQTLSVQYSSPYPCYSGVLNDITLGTKYANVSNFVGSRLVSLALCFVICSFGLFAIALCLFAHNKVDSLNQLLYLGIASVLISLWSACETKAMQILIGNVQAIMFVTFLSIMLFPIPLLLFFREQFTGKIRKCYNAAIGMFNLYFIIVVALQLLNVSNFHDYFVILLMLICMMVLFILYSLITVYQKVKTAQNRTPIFAVSFLLICVTIDMYRYFFGNLMLTSYSDTSLFVRVGILAMLFTLGYSSIQQVLLYYSKAEAYRMLSQTDNLSGLKNRAYLSETYPVVFQNAVKHKHQISVIMIDIDNFKNYNDHYGHSAGDEVIRTVAKIMQSEAENLQGTAIRYGGEEFLVMLPYVRTRDAVSVAEKIKSSIEAMNILHEYSTVAPFITVSQGICSAVPTCAESLKHFIDCSDRAMYSVKKNRKNGYALFAEKQMSASLNDDGISK